MNIDEINNQRNENNKLTEDEIKKLKMAENSDSKTIENLAYDALNEQNFRLSAELLFVIPTSEKYNKN